MKNLLAFCILAASLVPSCGRNPVAVQESDHTTGLTASKIEGVRYFMTDAITKPGIQSVSLLEVEGTLDHAPSGYRETTVEEIHRLGLRTPSESEASAREAVEIDPGDGGRGYGQRSWVVCSHPHSGTNRVECGSETTRSWVPGSLWLKTETTARAYVGDNPAPPGWLIRTAGRPPGGTGSSTSILPSNTTATASPGASTDGIIGATSSPWSRRAPVGRTRRLARFGKIVAPPEGLASLRAAPIRNRAKRPRPADLRSAGVVGVVRGAWMDPADLMSSFRSRSGPDPARSIRRLSSAQVDPTGRIP